MRDLGDLRLGNAVGLERDREHLALDPLRVQLDQVGVRLRQRHRDPVRQLEPLLLAHPVQGVNQVVDTPLELELGVERRVERHGDALLRGDGPALLAGALDEDLVRTEVVAEDAEAAALELLELARRESGAHGAELLAELRAERRQVRLHVQLGRLDRAELDLLDAQLLTHSSAWASRERRALDDEPPQRLTQLEPRRRTRLMPEGDDAPHLRDLRE